MVASLADTERYGLEKHAKAGAAQESQGKPIYFENEFQLLMGRASYGPSFGNNDQDAATDALSLIDEISYLRRKITTIERAITSKDAALQHSKPSTSFETNSSDANTATAANVANEEAETPRKTILPRMETSPWLTAFMRGPNSKLSEVAAVEVFEGEPVLKFEYDILSRAQTVPCLETFNPNYTISEHLLPGQSMLPERIRINSRHIIFALSTMFDSSSLLDSMLSIVLIRPFRPLVHFDKAIRKWYEDLKQRCQEFEAGNPSNEPVDDPRPTSETVGEASGSDENVEPDLNRHDQERDQRMGSCKTEATGAVSESSRIGPDVARTDPCALEAFEHCTALISFMDIISTKLNYLSSIECTMVWFSDLWYLFRPGDELIDANGKQAYRLIGVEQSKHRLIPDSRRPASTFLIRDQPCIRLELVFIDFDGKQLGPVSKTVYIHYFSGLRAVRSLEVYPTPFHFRQGEKDGLGNSSCYGKSKMLRQELIARGKLFVNCVGSVHMHYVGQTLDTQEDIDSAVVVDFDEALSGESRKEWRPEVVALFRHIMYDPNAAPTDQTICNGICCKDERVYDDKYLDDTRNAEAKMPLFPRLGREVDPLIATPRSLQDIQSNKYDIEESELVVMSYRVFGFILRSRKWARLDLACARDIEMPKSEHAEEEVLVGQKDLLTSDTAFSRLVLPKGHKDMVLSLITQHFRDKATISSRQEQVDIVRGKGKGLILLLHGAPGVGKTSTAEGVAELFKKPLFQITCGDLGSTAKEVEVTLEENFSLASRWGCILLLDEADVFLAARSREDFTRNGLVAVFLRVLEYYSGVLFLTTNRIGDFDEAFASRIHISLYYPPLDRNSTWQVLELNLNLLRQRFARAGRRLTIDETQIALDTRAYFEEHKDARWNGRQIRNACQTALALAEFEAQGNSYDAVPDPDAEVALRTSHFKTVSEAYLEFMKYLKDIYGTSADQKAKEEGIRAAEKRPLREFRPETRQHLQPISGQMSGGYNGPQYGAQVFSGNSPAPASGPHQAQASGYPTPYPLQQQYSSQQAAGGFAVPNTQFHQVPPSVDAQCFPQRQPGSVETPRTNLPMDQSWIS